MHAYKYQPSANRKSLHVQINIQQQSEQKIADKVLNEIKFNKIEMMKSC